MTSPENCHVMSLKQLDYLWHYEFRLCSILTSLPLRKCKAKPSETMGELFPSMNNDEFRELKQDILKMWVRASYFFKFKNQEGKGWGVFCPSEEDKGYPTTGFLSPTNPTTMGWLAKAPAVGQCPTAHRYLRSPLGENLYLGGPVSLVNHDRVGRILVHVPTCQSTAAQHIVKVVSKRKLIPGSELLWSYEDKTVGSTDLSLHLVSEWFLTECCSEVEALSLMEEPLSVQSSGSTASEPCANKKKRVVGGIRPLTNSCKMPRYCLCPYCGLNIDANKSYSPNLKRHLSLYHTLDIVQDIGKDPVNIEDPVTAKEFTLELDKIDNVLDALHNLHYNYQPACTFLNNFGKEVRFRKGVPIEDEKERVYNLFVCESNRAFKSYQVVFLKGAHLPAKYDDLLPCCKYSGHDRVVWEDTKPSNTNFSINYLKLGEEEKEMHKLQVDCAITEIGTHFQVEES